MTLDQQCEDCEQSSIDQSLKNLMTFPWIQVPKTMWWFFFFDAEPQIS